MPATSPLSRGRLGAACALLLCVSGPVEAQCVEQKLIASDATTNDSFGESVAIDGNLMIVGAGRARPNLEGAAYVYRLDPGGWVEEHILDPLNLIVSSGFGTAVDLQGSIAVVGAPNINRVYVFERGSIVGNPAWFKVAELTPPSPGADDGFGSSVSIDGSFIAVGSPLADGVHQNDGAVFIYRQSGVNWVSEATIQSPTAALGDTFGVSVSLSGTVLAVGVPRDDDVASNAGSVKIYTRTLVGFFIRWLEGPVLTASDGASGDNLGSAVSFSSPYLAAGAPSANTFTGAVYAFNNGGGTQWVQESKVVPNDLVGGDLFGSSVSIRPGSGLFVSAFLLVGAPERNEPGNTGVGAAYRFSRAMLIGGEIVYSSPGHFQGPGLLGGASFGSAVDQDDDRLLIGALGDMTTPLNFTGSAFVYSLSSIDSDGDGVPDPCDQCPGADDTIDVNADGIPDCLQLFGDANGDNIVNFDDIVSVLAFWLFDYSATPSGTGLGDANIDGIVTFDDITSALANWGRTGP